MWYLKKIKNGGGISPYPSYNSPKMKKYSVSAVSYLNTKPFLYGILKSGLESEIDLQLDIPSECARKLVDKAVDFALVPVAVIPELISPIVISDYCIGSVGAVKTVCILSEVPIERVTGVYLDYHSRTSVELTRILLQEYWQLSPELIPAQPGFENLISGNKAGLVIGDRAIVLKNRFPYHYDLGAIWTEHTGLPFVFAAWVSNDPLPEDFINRFNVALKLGIEQIPQLMLLMPSPDPGFDLKSYFTHNISYILDQQKRKALNLFLEKVTAGVDV